MKRQTEGNWSLLPFCAFALLFSLLLCTQVKQQGLPLIGFFVLFFLAGLAAGAILFLLVAAVCSLFIDRSKPQKSYSPFHSAMVTAAEGVVPAFFRIRIHTRGFEDLPGGSWLLVQNHRSAFDPLVTGWVLRKHRFAFISKPENIRFPVVGHFMHKACCLAIDRENDRTALRTILDAGAMIRDGVVSYGIYPEGTRNKGDGLLPFRNGAFKIAQKAKCPILVTAITGTERVKKNFPWRATDVELVLCAVLDRETAASRSTVEVGELARAYMEAECEKQ